MAAELKVSGRMTVKRLKENFKNAFEGTLRVYDGRAKAFARPSYTRSVPSNAFLKFSLSLLTVILPLTFNSAAISLSLYSLFSCLFLILRYIDYRSKKFQKATIVSTYQLTSSSLNPLAGADAVHDHLFLFLAPSFAGISLIKFGPLLLSMYC